MIASENSSLYTHQNFLPAMYDDVCSFSSSHNQKPKGYRALWPTNQINVLIQRQRDKTRKGLDPGKLPALAFTHLVFPHGLDPRNVENEEFPP